ncbi:hypothetical protein [Rubellimicrobium roseum]|uniref:Uncharacterized protein n=1 Tax=Rubellimicrobium roseum TaxID=687525 RepID=A0A5C4ND41_9RHOB|nr:hypothetical protein [Rubellimicrobium roseum]TNC72002.1 hypothetical protein FHG71_09720 [Rubellimicrobium roseum]
MTIYTAEYGLLISALISLAASTGDYNPRPLTSNYTFLHSERFVDMTSETLRFAVMESELSTALAALMPLIKLHAPDLLNAKFFRDHVRQAIPQKGGGEPFPQ